VEAVRARRGAFLFSGSVSFINVGRLITADNLITAARNLHLNPVELLVRYGLVPASAVVEYVEEISATPPVATKANIGAKREARIDLDAPGL
jgi:hypothetical protein